MSGPTHRIPKVELENFNYKKDIANRSLLSSLNAFELEILKEIIYSSLKFPLKELLSSLHIDEPVISPFLSRLTALGLLKIDSGVVFVDKDLRRFFEFQLSKFEGDFEPNTDYLQTLLQQVPIHVLPTWYAMPKNTDDIFASIIEKHLFTPKIYQKYLHEIAFEHPRQQEIMLAVLESKEHSLPASYLKKKFKLSDSEFLECLLYLEYSFVCFSIFAETENGFEERIVPLHEWKTWLEFHIKTQCKPLNSSSIQRNHPSDFGFVEEMSTIIAGSKNTHFLANSLMNRLSTLSYTEKGTATAAGKEWVTKPLQEKSMILYLHEMNRLRRGDGKFTDKDVREIEKSLKRVLKTGWVFLDDFLKGFYATVGSASPVTLKKQGKHWNFALPKYNESEQEFITNTVMTFFFEAGITATGMFEGKPCFTLTPFGQVTLGD